MSRREELLLYAALIGLLLFFAGGVYLWRDDVYQAEEKESTQLKLAVVTNDRDVTVAENAKLNEQKAKLSGRVETLQVEIADLRRARDKAIKERDDLQIEVNRLAKDLAHVTSVSEEQKRQLNAALAKLAAANAREKESQEKLDRKNEDTFSAVQRGLDTASRPRDPARQPDAGP